MSDPTTVSPSCIRFRTEDLELIQKAAKRADERVSPWIRAATLARAGLKDAKPLELVPAGDQVRCVRYRTSILERIVKAAKRDKLPFAVWVRAVAVEAARR